ncbi:hypothetical protein F5Y14DRAFT_460198 [Nemania sp. NC0429]|nr:hypothetical protein F5Y14DRAFT_460198 [Nemania sp. NC0429]
MEVDFGPTTGNMVDSSANVNATNAHYHNHYNLHHRHLGQFPQSAAIQQTGFYDYGYPSPTTNMRKRKAETQDNEHVSKRLSKRLGLLNLGKNGQKLYVPVESASLQPLSEPLGYNNPIQSSSSSAATLDDAMQLDNTKHKVYIYDLDAELSSADENSETESIPGSPNSGRGRITFMSDMKKHLRQIPPAVFANSRGELAGHNINDMQMVLYSEPSSLTVPREQDSVRKAILEARARARQKLKDGEVESNQALQPLNMTIPTASSPTTNLPIFNHVNGGNMAINGFGGYEPTHSAQNTTPWNSGTLAVDEDVDAMDTD